MTTKPKSLTPECRRTGQGSVGILAVLLVGAGLLNGCLSRPSLVKQSFAFSPPPLTSTDATKLRRSLGIRRLAIAEPSDDQSLVYRTGEFTYERDPYAEFLVPPAEVFAATIRGSFRGAGVFSAVTEPGSAFRPDTVVEVFIDQLYGDFRNPADPSAVLAMRFIFFDAPAGIPGKVLVQKGCSRQIHLKARTAASLVEGWNEAMKQILEEVCSDLKTMRES